MLDDVFPWRWPFSFFLPELDDEAAVCLSWRGATDARDPEAVATTEPDEEIVVGL
jgi:hypothetical protein